MNHIYKVIWNASIGTWIAVSEIAKGRVKSRKVNKKTQNNFISQTKLFDKFVPISLLTLSVALISNQSFAQKTITTTGTGVGVATSGSVANDDSINILDWQNPFLPAFMQLGAGSQPGGGAVAIGENAKAIARR